GAYGSSGFQYRLATTGDYQPSLRFPWLAAAAERSLEIATKRYREGYSGFQRVLDAQRAVATQADRELTNQGSHISAVIALYKALGGGWIETPIEALIPDTTRDTMQQRTDWGNLLKAPLPVQESPVTETSAHD
ncbi:MAG: hypothetical protein ABW068_17200, partial [Candidatus Thiodiazotropha sp.]